MNTSNLEGRPRRAFYIVMCLAALLLTVSIWWKAASFLPRFPSLPAPQLRMITRPEPPIRYAVEIFTTQSKTIRHTTAYVAGDPSQTDSTPCISADGSDICLELSMGEKICAANFVPMGTRLYIPGFGICTVKDRMNKRYRNRVDLAMQINKRNEADRYGKKPSEVHILK